LQFGVKHVTADGCYVRPQFIVLKRDALQHADLGLDWVIEEIAVLFSGFHCQGKGCQFTGTLVNLNAEEVLAQDLFRDLGMSIAFLFVDGIEQVKGIDQYMSRTAGRVANLDLFRGVDFQKIGFRLLRFASEA